MATAQVSFDGLTYRPAPTQASAARAFATRPVQNSQLAPSNMDTTVGLRQASSRSSSGRSAGIKKKSTSTKEHERLVKNIVRGVQRIMEVSRTPSEKIMDKLCSGGKLTNEGLSLLDRVLWDYEIGYADAGPACGIGGSSADAFCHCTMKELSAWRGSLGHLPTERDEKATVAILLRAYFESFHDLFQEKRTLEESEMWESAYEVQKVISNMKDKFSQRAQEEFFDALWEHFLVNG